MNQQSEVSDDINYKWFGVRFLDKASQIISVNYESIANSNIDFQGIDKFKAEMEEKLKNIKESMEELREKKVYVYYSDFEFDFYNYSENRKKPQFYESSAYFMSKNIQFAAIEANFSLMMDKIKIVEELNKSFKHMREQRDKMHCTVNVLLDLVADLKTLLDFLEWLKTLISEVKM